MKRLVIFCRERSHQIQTIFKKMAIALLIYSAFRFFARKGFFESLIFLEKIIYSPIVEVLFFLTLVFAVIAGTAKYFILRKPLF